MYKCEASHGHNFDNNIEEGEGGTIDHACILAPMKCRFLIFSVFTSSI